VRICVTWATVLRIWTFHVKRRREEQSEMGS
jgi:hypothetical protein